MSRTAMINNRINKCPLCNQNLRMCNNGKVAVCFTCKNIFKRKFDSKYKFSLSAEYEILEIK